VKNRNKRHDIIRAIIREQKIRTQHDLVEALRTKGYDCTQATVSRDIKDLGLEKAAGSAYMLKEDVHLKKLAAELLLEVFSVGNLVIAKTKEGMAQGVAAAIEAAEIDNILASLAGDDTIFMVAATPELASSVVKALKALWAKAETSADWQASQQANKQEDQQADFSHEL
jgi:transcriptional regulator of arginine metabolism